MIHLAISAGDPQGIGPEVTLRALTDLAARDPDVAFRVHGPTALLLRCAESLGLDLPEGQRLGFIDSLGLVESMSAPPSPAGGAAAFAALESAFADVRAGRAAALVTAPLSKEAVARSQPGFSGHTEWIGEALGARPLMMLAHEDLRVALVTTHLPLSRVAAAITEDIVGAALAILGRDLRGRFGIAAPRLAVLGLNPHAGEGGLLGREELDIIAPAIAAAGGIAAGIEGPFPADSFFVPERLARFDAVLAMYHDQGLIPVKMRGFSRTVNLTLGLPMIRTSPDHGTGFDLVKRGLRPDCGSMIAALEAALKLVRTSVGSR